MASRGGRQPGAGRPPTNRTAKTREIAKALAMPGLQPLEIMCHVMRELYEDGQALERGTERRHELLKAAADVASRAAKYMHAPKAAEDADGNAVGITEITMIVEYPKSPNEPTVIDGVSHTIDIVEDTPRLQRALSAK